MNYKVLLFFFVIFLIQKQSLALDGFPLAETNEARFYMANFLENNGSRSWISCTGTFIKPDFILTAASCVDGNHHNIDVRSGRINVSVLGSGNRHIVQKVVLHPKYDPKTPFTNNIAVVQVLSPSLEEPHQPRTLEKIITNRICTMFGWEGFNTNQDSLVPLRMYAVPVGTEQNCDDKAPEAFCSLDDLNSSFAACGGLMGAPIFCAGNGISGIVVNDNFCQPRARVSGSFINIADFRSFIDDALAPPATEAPATTTASAMTAMLSQLLMLVVSAIFIKNFY